MKHILFIIFYLLFLSCSSTKSKDDFVKNGDFVPLHGTPMTVDFYNTKNIKIAKNPGNLVIIAGSVKIDYNLFFGTADVYRNKLFVPENNQEPVIRNIFAQTIVGGKLITSANFKRPDDSIFLEEINDGFGKGVKVSVKNTDDDLCIWQNFYAYETKEYILLETIIESSQGLETNYIAPLTAIFNEDKRTGSIFSVASSVPSPASPLFPEFAPPQFVRGFIGYDRVFGAR